MFDKLEKTLRTADAVLLVKILLSYRSRHNKRKETLVNINRSRPSFEKRLFSVRVQNKFSKTSNLHPMYISPCTNENLFGFYKYPVNSTSL